MLVRHLVRPDLHKFIKHQIQNPTYYSPNQPIDKKKTSDCETNVIITFLFLLKLDLYFSVNFIGYFNLKGLSDIL